MRARTFAVAPALEQRETRGVCGGGGLKGKPSRGDVRTAGPVSHRMRAWAFVIALAALVSGERNQPSSCRRKQLLKETPGSVVRWEFVVNRCKENLDWLETLICHIPNHVGRVDIFVFDKCGTGPLDQIEQTCPDSPLLRWSSGTNPPRSSVHLVGGGGADYGQRLSGNTQCSFSELGL